MNADRPLRRRKAGRALVAGTLLTAGALLASAVSAAASNPRAVTLHLPSQRVEDALLDLAVQAQVSLGGDLAACRGVSPTLNGPMTLDAALSRLLAGSGCAYSLRGDGAVIIRRTVRVRTTRAAEPSPPRRAPSPVETPADEIAELSDVIVTAERRPESPQYAPVAVTAVSGDQIAAAGAVDTNDLGALVAGMTVTNLGSGRNKILLRGMSDGAFTGLTQSTVGLYLNSAPITYSAPDPDLKLIDIDRVEVLRGPQGTLYGTGPIGGVVRIVTQRPDASGPSFDLSLTQSTTHSGGGNSDYSAVLNLPLPGGRGAIRGLVYEEAFGGYINDVNLNLRRVNDGSRRGGRLAATAFLRPGWDLTAGVVHQSIDTEDTHYVYRYLGGLRRANLVREPHANDFDQANLNLHGRGEWGRVDASVAYVRHRFNSRYDASSALPAFGSNGRIGALDEGKTIDLLVAELTFNSRPSERLRWLTGGFVSTGQTRTDTDLAALRPIRAEVYSERRDDDLNEAALFGEISYDLTPQLTAIVGGRVYGFDYDTRSDVRQGQEQRPFRGEKRTYGLSPKLALDYRPTDRLNLYAQISQGHRTGGFNTAGPITLAFTGGVGTPSREYRSDTLWNYEVGAKALLWDGRVQARAAAFLADWRDIQSDQFLPSGLAYAVNVGDGANKGVELEVNWRPVESFEIRANTLLADPEITRPSDSFNSRGDAGLPGVPAVSANVNLAWRRSVGWGLDVFAGGGLAYVGASRLTFDAARRYRMGDYVTGRFSAGVDGRGWAAVAFVENPFDTQANTFAFGDPFRLPEALAATPLRPRTVGLTLSLSL